MMASKAAGCLYACVTGNQKSLTRVYMRIQEFFFLFYSMHTLYIAQVTQFQKFFTSYIKAAVTICETDDHQIVTVTPGSADPGFLVTGESYRDQGVSSSGRLKHFCTP